MSAEARAVGPLRRTLSMVRPHLGAHRWLAVGGVVALLADVAFRVLEPWPVKWVVDSATASLGADLRSTTGLPAPTATYLATCAVALAAIIAGRALANYLSTVAFAFVGSRVATALRARVFAHVQGLSLRYHATASHGDMVQRLVGDVGRLQEVAVSAGLPLVGNVMTLVVLSGVMLWLDPLLTLALLGAGVAYVVVSRRTSPHITTASRRTRRGEGTLAGSASEALSAIRVVQAYRLEQVVAREFAAGNEVALKDGVKARRLAAGLERRTDVIVGVTTAVVLGFGGWRVVQGAMTPGELILYFMYLKIAMKPLRDMAKYTGRIARAAASGERVADLLDVEPDVADLPGAPDLPPVRGDLIVASLWAEDGRGAPLFRGLDLHVVAGQHVCLLGPSGAGKSTLASYLLRLADPRDGGVFLDGHDVREVTLASLRSQVSILLQESVLFATTVRENIRYGRLDATDAEVEDAARRAGAHDFVGALPQGYDTDLGSRGDTLSGGQRQRLAIARAMLRDAPVVVLDEPTSGLDPATARQVQSSIAELTRGRTTLAITHDHVQVRDCDRVLWMEHGRIVEDGPPQRLLADPGSRLAGWMLAQEAG